MRITGYNPFECSLVANPGTVKIELKGDFEIKLGERRCAGRFINGKYIECREKKYPYCDRCKPFEPCAICRGKCLKQKMDCTSPHSVYLALFSPNLLKVGVTRTERLAYRLREQGADVGVEIAKCENGMVARLIESRISKFVRDRMSTKMKIRGLTQEPDINVLEKALMIFGRIGDIMEFGYFDRDITHQEIIPLSPAEFSVISGTGIGCKGSIFVFESCNLLYALDLKELIGFDLVDDESNNGSLYLNRYMQSSINLF
ncbi:DUF2797 domain-containing protein [Methanosarcinales archaeon]|nr:MAG: DUF2797 domain-containing protein [Methanosarcinales archaeon]